MECSTETVKVRYGFFRALATCLLALLLAVNGCAFMLAGAARAALSEEGLAAAAGDTGALADAVGIGCAPSPGATDTDLALRGAVTGLAPSIPEEALAAVTHDAAFSALVTEAAVALGQYMRCERVEVSVDAAAVRYAELSVADKTGFDSFSLSAVDTLLSVAGETLTDLEPLTAMARCMLSKWGQFFFAALAAADLLLIYLLNSRFPGRLIIAAAVPVFAACAAAVGAAMLGKCALLLDGGALAGWLALLYAPVMRSFMLTGGVMAGLTLMAVLAATLLKRLGKWRAALFGAAALTLTAFAVCGAFAVEGLPERLYAAAEAAYQAGDCRGAAELYGRSGLDGGETLADCRLELAAAALDEGDGALAAAYLSLVPEREETADMRLRSSYLRAEGMLAAGRYTAARAAFAALGDYGDSAERITECDYGLAAAALAAGDIDAAFDMFVALGDYSDSAARVLECWYAYGEAAEAAGDYEYAAACFERAAGFGDAGERYLAARYQLAGQTADRGGYTALSEALEIYLSLGDYLDSAEQAHGCWQSWLKECAMPFDFAADFEDERLAALISIARIWVGDRERSVTVHFELERASKICSCRILYSPGGEVLTQSEDFLYPGRANAMTARAAALLDADGLCFVFAYRYTSGFGSPPVQWGQGLALEVENQVDFCAWYGQWELGGQG